MRPLLYAILTVLLFGAIASCAPDMSEAGRREAWVQRTLDNLSMEQMVSQMFVVDVPEGPAVLDSAAYAQTLSRTVDFGAGGIVLFKSPAVRQAAFVHDLQNRSTVPLFVAQDLEWGASMRVGHATEFPRAMGIGATGDVEMAYIMGQITAREARAVGVNILLAPVADVNSRSDNPVIGTRSFGDQPGEVARFVARFVAGAQSEQVLATAKHFPGHGSTSVDSHVSTPVIDGARIASDSLDLLPFIAAIGANVGAIMTAHLAVSDAGAGKNVPATLSYELLELLLRKRLGFEGLIVSDALNMGGVGSLTVDSLAVQAVSAGVDLLLMPPEPMQARRAILSAVNDGRISRARIRASVERILRAKAGLSLTRMPALQLGAVRPALAAPEHKSAAALAARRSIVALRNRNSIPEIGSSKSLLLIEYIDSRGDRTASYFDYQVRALYKGSVTTIRVAGDRWAVESGNVFRAAADHDLVIFADFTSEFRSLPRTIGSALAQLSPVSKRLVFAGMGSPYNAVAVPNGVDAVLLAFGASRPSIRAMAQAIFGSTDVCGRLPIRLSADFIRGAGICIRQAMPRWGRPEELGMNGRVLGTLDAVIERAIAESAFPGAALVVGRGDLLAYAKGYGHYTYEGGPRTDPSSLFDLASLTKVIATTTAVMLLYEADALSLDDPVAQYIPEFAANGKDAVTIRDLLTHTGGLIPFRAFYQTKGMSRTDVLSAIHEDSLFYEPGSTSRYSDFGPIMLAEIVERITDTPFDVFTRKRIFDPLGMTSTGYRTANGTSDPTIVPTENDDYFRHRLIQGEVHDENAYLLGGTAGHAGLFSTAEDLSRFAHMILDDGRIGDRYFLQPETIRLFTTATDPTGSHTRALGWDTKSPVGYSAAGQFFGHRSFGHTGFTGTSIWFDPDQRLFVILLTNRVYPTRNNSRLTPVRPAVADVVFRSLRSGSHPNNK